MVYYGILGDVIAYNHEYLDVQKINVLRLPAFLIEVFGDVTHAHTSVPVLHHGLKPVATIRRPWGPDRDYLFIFNMNTRQAYLDVASGFNPED